MSTCSYSSSNGILEYLDENRFFSILTTSTFVIIGIFLYIVSLYKYFEKKHIPRIAQPSLPYGNIKDVIEKNTTFFELVSKYYKKLKKKGLKYGGMYLFFNPCIILVDTSLIDEILLNKTTFSNAIRTNENISKIFDIMPLSGVIDEYMKKSINTLKTEIVKSLRENKQQYHKSLYKFVMESVCMIFGIDTNEDIFNLIEVAEQDMTSSSFKHYLHLVYPYFKQNKCGELTAVIANSMLYNKKNDIRMRDVLQNILDNETGETNRDLLAVYISSVIENIIYSYNSTLFCLYELSKNTVIQEELKGEIRRFTGTNKSFTDLPYLDAVVKGKYQKKIIKNTAFIKFAETLRLYPAVPLIVKRCEENYESVECSLKLAKGNLVLIPTNAIHHDVNIYVDPNKFDPDRFLEDDIEKLSTFLPFSYKVTSHSDNHKGNSLTL